MMVVAVAYGNPKRLWRFWTELGYSCAGEGEFGTFRVYYGKLTSPHDAGYARMASICEPIPRKARSWVRDAVPQSKEKRHR